jgi:hypothetical protein
MSPFFIFIFNVCILLHEYNNTNSTINATIIY